MLLARRGHTPPRCVMWWNPVHARLAYRLAVASLAEGRIILVTRLQVSSSCAGAVFDKQKDACAATVVVICGRARITLTLDSYAYGDQSDPCCPAIFGSESTNERFA